MYISNHNIIKNIDLYINNWLQNKKKIQPIFLDGLSGSGKSYCINNILQKYNINYYNSYNYNNYYEIEFNILNKDILTIMNNSKKCIIFDDFNNETLFNNVYQNIEKLLKKINVFNTLIIFISNNILKKKINNIKKYCTYFHFDLPKHIELFNFLKNKYNIEDNIINKIIKKSNYNIGKCILNIELLNKNKTNNINFLYDYNNKIDIMSIVNNIYYNNVIIDIYDNSIIYSFYHNLFNYIHYNKFGNINNKLKIIKKIHNNLIFNNLIEQKIYIEKNYDLKIYHNLPINTFINETKKYDKKYIELSYTNYFSKYFILLNKNNIIEKLSIKHNIFFNKFNHNGLKLLYNDNIEKKEKDKINKYNLYSII